MNGKQVRIKRAPTIDGMSIEEYIENNADIVWLHQNEMWEHINDEDYIYLVNNNYNYGKA